MSGRTRRGSRIVRASLAGALLAGVLLSGASLLAPAPAAADVEDFGFSSLEVDYYLTADAAGRARLVVIEHWVAEFPDHDQNRGIIRSLPRRDGPVSLGTVMVGVTDENGGPVYWARGEDSRSELVVEVDDDAFKHGTHHYVVSYRMRDVVRFFEDGDEFYPNVTAEDRAQPIARTAARVHLGPSIAERLDGRSECFTGPRGSTEQDCDIRSAGAGSTADWPVEALAEGADSGETTIIEVSSRAGLAPAENLSFVLGFEPGSFTQPPPAPEVAATPWIAGAAGAFALLVVGSTGAARARDRARLPWPRIVQYTPPRGVSLRVAAESFGRRSRLLAAGVVDLAVRGFLEVRTDDAAGASAKPDDYRLVLVSQKGASDDERALLDAIFGTGAKAGKTVKLSSRSVKRAERIQKFLSGSREAAQTAGMVAGGRAALITLIVFAAMISVILLIAAIAFTVQGYAPWWLALVAVLVVVALFVVAVVVRPSPVRVTRRGAELVQYLNGVRDYVELAEADRLRFLQSPTTADRRRVGSLEPDDGQGDERAATQPELRLRLYERLLAYAVLFGLEKQWGALLEELGEGLAATPSTTMYLHHAVVTGALSQGLTGVSSAAVASGGGSAGSGFSGGGFSGGGFGGGGVGGR